MSLDPLFDPVVYAQEQAFRQAYAQPPPPRPQYFPFQNGDQSPPPRQPQTPRPQFTSRGASFNNPFNPPYPSSPLNPPYPSSPLSGTPGFTGPFFEPFESPFLHQNYQQPNPFSSAPPPAPRPPQSQTQFIPVPVYVPVFVNEEPPLFGFPPPPNPFIPPMPMPPAQPIPPSRFYSPPTSPPFVSPLSSPPLDPRPFTQDYFARSTWTPTPQPRPVRDNNDDDYGKGTRIKIPKLKRHSSSFEVRRSPHVMPWDNWRRPSFSKKPEKPRERSGNWFGKLF